MSLQSTVDEKGTKLGDITIYYPVFKSPGEFRSITYYPAEA